MPPPSPASAPTETPTHSRQRSRWIPVDTIIAQDRPLSKSLANATWFALEATACCAALYFTYHLARSPGVGWAIVSSLLVLIPDVKQSVATALARVSANVVGALTGLAVAKLWNESPAAIILAIVLTSYICHIARLDLGLRTACVAVVIIMTAHPGEVVMSSFERFVAVISGCGVGVIVQLLALAVQTQLKRLHHQPADRPLETPAAQSQTRQSPTQQSIQNSAE